MGRCPSGQRDIGDATRWGCLEVNHFQGTNGPRGEIIGNDGRYAGQNGVTFQDQTPQAGEVVTTDSTLGGSGLRCFVTAPLLW